MERKEHASTDAGRYTLELYNLISSQTLIGLAGLILAVLTYFAGVQRTKRRLKAKGIHTKQEVIRDFGLFKTKLEDEIDRPSLLHIGTAARSFPVALAIKTLISNHPIDYWYHILDDEEFKSLLDRILDFRDQYRFFKKGADAFDLCLRQEIRLYNANRGTEAINDQADHAYFLGRIHELSTDDIMPWIDLPKEASRRLEAIYKALKDSDSIKVAIQQYLRERKKLESKIQELSEVLLSRHTGGEY